MRRADDGPLDSEEHSPTLLWASRVGALQRLEMLPERRQGPDLHLPGRRSKYDLIVPPERRFQLHWLQHTEMHHLSVKLDLSGQVRSFVLPAR